MSDPFESSRYSIEHAKRHISQLEREIGAFVKSRPYTQVVETNAKGTEDSYKIKLTKPLPAALPGIAFDSANNLRSALDQAGYAVATAAGKRGRDAKFPFGDTLAEVQSRVKRGSKDIPKEVFDIMVARQPYKGGNNLLWALNKLANTNKHEVIVPMVLATGNMHVTKAYFGRVVGLEWPPRWDSTKNEMVIATVPYGETPHIDLQIQILVAIGKVEGVGGQPALPVFNGMLTEVQNSLTTIEAEALRLGIVH